MLEKHSNEFIGWTVPANKHVNFYDFGYRLRQEYWGKGYATEAAKASLNYGITTLELKDIHAMTDVDNKASRRIQEKIGFSFIEIFKYDAEPTWRGTEEPTTCMR